MKSIIAVAALLLANIDWPQFAISSLVRLSVEILYSIGVILLLTILPN